MGPYSPARGSRWGFRFHQGRLGTWVVEEEVSEFWPIVDGEGSRAIQSLVLGTWRGGRILFLPNGYIVKPLQADVEVGKRVLIGRFQGALVLERRNQPVFDLSNPGNLLPGELWPGPTTTGLECVIQADGSLVCYWSHPAPEGSDKVSQRLHGPDPSLAKGFRLARKGETGGRVRITANGHVITNYKVQNNPYKSFYVGYINPNLWGDWKHWIERKDK
jgi:hypothetical protein